MLKTGFFNSVDGDRKYSADDLSSFFVKLISDGVFPNPSNNLKVVAKSGLTVTVKEGFGFIKAKYAENTSWPRWHTGHVAKKSWKWNRKWQLEFRESCAFK